MTQATRKLVLGHGLLLLAGGLVGWLYDQVAWGLLVSALAGLGWQLRQLIRFESALRNQRFGSLKYGDSIWSQLYSRFTLQRQQIKEFKKSHRTLLKEIRKSTSAMPDGGVIINADCEIVRCNKAAQRLAG